MPIGTPAPLSVTALRRLMLERSYQHMVMEAASFDLNKIKKRSTSDKEKEALRTVELRLEQLGHTLYDEEVRLRGCMRLCEPNDLAEALTMVIAAATYVSLSKSHDHDENGEDLEHADELLHRGIRGIGRATGVTAESPSG